MLVDDAFGETAAHGERQRGGKVVALILDDECSTIADEVFEPGLDLGKFGAYGVGANADDDDVVRAEIPGD